MEPTRQLDHIVPHLTGITEQIDEAQLHDPTPCSELDVAGVLTHMITGGGQFAFLFRGETPPTQEPAPPTDEVLVKHFQTTMEDLLDAVHSPGAMERVITAPLGEMPGDAFARLVAFDGLIHGWDLAQATGQPYTIDEDVVAAVDEFARQAITPEMRDSGMFGDPTCPPPWAGTLERLVAFSGRSV